MNPDELRSRLAVAFPDELPPPDLAVRAEKKAGRIRRRRTAAVAVVAALAVAVPLSVAAVTGPDRALPPAGPADSACVWSDRVIPRQGAATTQAEIDSWGFRGDPAYRERAVQIAAFNADARTPRVLYADATLVVFAARLTYLPDQWTVLAVRTDEDGKELGSAGGLVAEPGADAAISLLVSAELSPDVGDMGNLLVVLAPRGSAGTTFRGCRNGTTFTVRGSGDTLVRNVGTLDAPGTLSVRTASGGVGYQGPAADLPFRPGVRPVVQLPPVEPVPVPAGARNWTRQSGQGTVTEKPPPAGRATVLLRCRVFDRPGPVEVHAGPTLIGTARCDGSVERIVENTELAGAIRLGPDNQQAPAVAYDVVVVSD